MLEQQPERRSPGFGVPMLKNRKGLANIGGGFVLGRLCGLEQHKRNGTKMRDHFRARLAVRIPAEPQAQDGQSAGHGDLFAFGRGHGVRDRLHEIEPPEGESALLLQRRDLIGRLPPEVCFG
ncbi:MAG: hypothetical protein E5W83_16390 [Mesorhizobium sp.]|nr:MAG: hypothetical protein E5W83_16390 [Mesorhizobium sp.]